MARLIDNLDYLAKGNLAALQADLRRRRRGHGRHDPRAARLRSQARLPLHGARTGSTRIVPDVFVARRGAGWAVELNSATLPRLLVNRTYYNELASGPQDRQSKAWLNECLQSANWLMKALDQRARTIVKVASEIVTQPGRLLPPRRLAPEAADPARGRRDDRHARIDGQPGHLEQISLLRPRPLRAQIFLHQRHPVAATAATRPRPKR